LSSGARRIGLLGGSFNPAHEGHRYVSLLALKRLRLDEVWWMLTPQNPLKDARDTAPLEKRLKAATRVAEHPRIRVTDIERRLGTTHTADTLALLLARFPKYRFVWLMGADNLVQVSKWKDWRRIFRLVPIAVFSRPPYSRRALVARAARVFARNRAAESRARSVVTMAPPAWVFLHMRPHPGSATRIRARSGTEEQSARREDCSGTTSIGSRPPYTR
jgi:nicotinate-nucleotide adenylyltransferase